MEAEGLDVAALASQVLSYAIITGSLALKVPQILKVIREMMKGEMFGVNVLVSGYEIWKC